MITLKQLDLECHAELHNHMIKRKHSKNLKGIEQNYLQGLNFYGNTCIHANSL